MATRVPRTLVETGTAPVEYAASNGGDHITNNKVGKLFVRARNASGAPIDVTVTSPKKCNQGHTHDLVVTIAAGASRDIGPLPASRYGPSVAVGYSAYANLFIDPMILPGT